MRSLDITVALDGSPASLAASRVALALASGAAPISRVTGLHILSVMRLTGRVLQDLAGLLGFEPVLVPERVEGYYRSRGLEFLSGLEESCRLAGVRHRSVLDQGNVVERIVHHGDQADLGVMGARGLTEEAFPGHGGGTVERVVRSMSSTCMVIPQDQEPIKGLVLGFDGSDGASHALRSARHLVEIIPVPLHAVCICNTPWSPDPLEEVRHYFQDMRVDLTCHYLPGEPRESLLLAAQRFDCNMIALGYRGRSNVKDFFLGRVTEWLLHFADIALLISR